MGGGGISIPSEDGTIAKTTPRHAADQRMTLPIGSKRSMNAFEEAGECGRVIRGACCDRYAHRGRPMARTDGC